MSRIFLVCLALAVFVAVIEGRRGGGGRGNDDSRDVEDYHRGGSRGGRGYHGGSFAQSIPYALGYSEFIVISR